VLSAYHILSRAKCLLTPYEFSEELVGGDGVFSPVGRKSLLSRVQQLGQANFTAIYTCEPYIFKIACLDGKPYVLDTHPIPSDLGGNGGGLIRIYADSSDNSWTSLCGWVWKRLASGGMKETEGQSLSVMTPVFRK